MFPNESFEGGGKGFIVLKQQDGKGEARDFVRAKRSDNVNFQHYGGLVHNIYSVEVETPTAKGDCGAPYVLTTPQGPVILGIHVTGCGALSQCLFFTQQQIRTFIGGSQLVAGIPMISSKSVERKVGELSQKSVFRYMQNGSATVYGSFTGFKITPRTRVELTPMNLFCRREVTPPNTPSPSWRAGNRGELPL